MTRRPPRPRRTAVLAAVAFVAATVTSVLVARGIATGPPIRRAGWSLLWPLGIWCAMWGVAVACVRQLRRRTAVVVVLVAAAAVRIAAMVGEPITSDDLYRYSWDGRVQAAGIDPYRSPPNASELVRLREDWLWPSDQRCQAIRRPAGCTLINRPGEPTIYPPVAEAWFAGVYRVAGIESRHKAWQIAGLAVDLVTVWLLIVALRRWRGDERWVALYALAPVPALELVNNGHVDGLAVALMVTALIVARPPPRPVRLLRSSAARDVVVGLLIGAAVLVKLYPGLLLVAIAVAPGAQRWRRVARSGTSALALIVAAYVPHVVAVGGKVLGYLPGYLNEEDYGSGGRFLLAGVVGLHGDLAAAASVATFIAVIAVLLVRRSPLPIAAVSLFGTLLLVTSPVQPWYSVSVLALAALAGRPRWVAVSLAGYPYFLAVILGSPHAVGIGQASYGAAAVIVIAGTIPSVKTALARRRRSWSRLPVVVEPASR